MLKRGFILVLMLVLVSLGCYAFFPSINPKTTIGFDYHLANPKNTFYLVGLYDGTTVYLDTNLDGIYSNYTTLNKLSTSTISSSYAISAKVHADKPIIISYLAYFREAGYDRTAWGSILPSAQDLEKEYYVASPFNNLYVVATQSNTNLLIDKTNDGTWDTNTTISPGVSYSYGTGDVQAGSRIKSDKPILVIQRAQYTGMNNWGFILTNSSGTDFYLGYPVSFVYIVALQNATNVEWDTNLDDVYEGSVVLNNTDTYSSSSWPVSTHIRSNGTIIISKRIVVGGEDSWCFLLPPAKELGQEYRVQYSVATYGVLYVIATQSNTNLLIDKEDDGTWDTNTTIDPGTVYSYGSASIQSGSRVRANKPVVASERFYYSPDTWDDACVGAVSTQPGIATTSDVSPSPADFDSEVNISNKVWNMLEEVYNLTISASLPDDFTPWPSTSILNITIGVYNTSDDLVAGTEELPVSLTSGGGKYSYSFSYQNTTLLSQLNQSNYVKFTYKATTPSSTGTYIFDLGTVDIAQATVWKYPWE